MRWLFAILLFLAQPLRADTVHFFTDNQGTSQRWHGKVLEISESEIVVEFNDRKQTLVRSIHLSRILSIYFDDHFLHSYPIRLRGVISDPIGGNLTRARKIYLSAAAFQSFPIEFPEVKLYGYNLLVGNITTFNRKEGRLLAIVKSQNGSIEEVDFSHFLPYIRAWVR